MTNKKSKVSNVPNLRFPGFDGEWEQVTLGECSISLDYGMNSSAKNFDGVNKYIRITDIDENSSRYKSDNPVSPSGNIDEKYLVGENDVLFARTGASTGKSYLYHCDDGKLYFAGFLIRAKIRNEYDSKFIFSQTQTQKYKKWVQLMSMRSGQPGINSQEYSSFKFFLPKTNLEQQKISSFLSLIDERIHTQNKIIKQLETLIKGLYQKIFEAGRFQFSVLPLKLLCIIKKGEQINASELSETGLYYVMNGGISPSGYYSEYNSEAKTISISEGGNSCGYVQFNNSKFWYGGHCYTLNNIHNSIKNKYLYYYLKANENKIMALRVGSGLPNIQKSALEKFEVKIPNIYVQEKVILALDSLSNKVAIESKLLKKYQQQKKHLLQNLFI